MEVLLATFVLPAPPNVDDFRIISTNHNSAVLRWSSPHFSLPIKYQVQYSDGRNNEILESNQTVCRLQHLQPDTSYSVKVIPYSLPLLERLTTNLYVLFYRFELKSGKSSVGTVTPYRFQPRNLLLNLMITLESHLTVCEEIILGQQMSLLKHNLVQSKTTLFLPYHCRAL